MSEPLTQAIDRRMAYDEFAAYPALGFNPAPGNTGTVTSLSHNFLAVSTHLNEAREAMMRAGQSGAFWQGDAAQAFHGDIGKLPDYLDKATRSLGDAGRALDGWANDLSAMQRTAADYEQQAEEAQRKLTQAQNDPDLGLAGEHFDNDQDLQQAQQRLDAANANLRAAEADLNAIRDQAKRLFAQHQDLANQVADALKHAKDEAPDKPGVFSSIGHAFGSIVHGIGDLAKNTWHFVQKHANAIKFVGDMLSIAGTVLSCAAAATAAIPVVGEVVEAVSLGVNGAALETHLLAKVAGANVSDKTLAMDAIGMIPGGAAVSGLKVAGNVTRIAKSTVKAVQLADDGARLARGAEAAGKVMEELGTRQIGKWAHWGQKFVSIVPKLGKRIGVEAVQGVDKAYEASNVAGHVVGAVTGTVVHGAIHAWTSAGMGVAKDFADRLTHGQPLPSAGQVWREALQDAA